MAQIQSNVWGRWSREHAVVEGKSASIPDCEGEFLVLAKVPRRRGKHRWQVKIVRKNPAASLCIGMAVDIQDSELQRGALDTHFNDRLWHYCNSDGCLRNGGRQVAASDQKEKRMTGTGDVVDVFFDADAGQITFGVNGSKMEAMIRDVIHRSFLQQLSAGEQRSDKGCGEFFLFVSLTAGDLVEMEDAPAELTYTTSICKYACDQDIPPNEPRLESGSAPMRFSIDRPLPPGLNFDEMTGVISGNPTGQSSLSMQGWRDLCFQMYSGKTSDNGWKKARNALLKEVGMNLTEDQIRERAREIFNKYDEDGSGQIDFDELRALMNSLNIEVSDEELMHMAAELDVDGSAEIEILEFEEMLYKMYHSKDKYGAWKTAGFALIKKLGEGLDVELELPIRCREVFNEFDEDGSGKIDIGELELALNSLGLDVDSATILEMMDEAGIDQGLTDPGIDFQSWKNLLTNIYVGNNDDVWENAKVGIVKMIGPNLKKEELWERLDQIFQEMDSDGSGELSIDELVVALNKVGVKMQEGDLSRMIDETNLNGRLWTVTAANRLGSTKFVLKLSIMVAVSNLQYESVDFFCAVEQKLKPIKVATLTGTKPHRFSIDPALPEGMSVDEETGTISGRPLHDSDKVLHTVTVRNDVGSAQCQVYFQALNPPAELQYSFPNVIYRQGELQLEAWKSARTSLISKLGKRLDATKLVSAARELFDALDSDHSGSVDAQEMGDALKAWGVEVSEEDLSSMMREASNSSQDEEQEIFFDDFVKIVKQMYSGHKEGADHFKTSQEGDWIQGPLKIKDIQGTQPFIFTTSPELPPGLKINRDTGAISGVPLKAVEATDYLVRASNRVGFTECTVTLEVMDPPSNFRYKLVEEVIRFATNTACRPLKCAVSGTARSSNGNMRFHVGVDPQRLRTLFDSYDEDQSGTLELSEFKEMLSLLGIRLSKSDVLSIFSAIASDGSDSIAFEDFSRYFSSGLPRGLQLNEEDGSIAGVPFQPARLRLYVITAWNPVGETSITVNLEVQEAPSRLQYLVPDVIYRLNGPAGFSRVAADPETLSECGHMFYENTLTFEGSDVRFSVYPPLPPGLELDEETGTISGTPTRETTSSGKPGVTESVRFVVTGKNFVGSDTVDLHIEVAKVATVLIYMKFDSVYSLNEQIKDNEVLLCDASAPRRFTVAREIERAREVFRRFDKDDSGALDPSEFRICLRDLGEKLTEGEFRWLLTQVDKDGTGQIEFDEFWDYWKQLPYGLELEESTGTIYGRPLRNCELGTWVVTVWNKVGHYSVKMKMQVLDESRSRERDADRRRQFWYSGERGMKFVNGSEYTGSWKNGKFDGRGSYRGEDGYVYEGEWKYGKRHGTCMESFPDGMKFEGEYLEGCRHGRGKLTWPDGSVYEGDFINGRREGKGMQKWKDQDGAIFKYDGDWLNDKQHGSGLLAYKGEACSVESRFGSVLLMQPHSRSRRTFSFPDRSFYDGEVGGAEEKEETCFHGSGSRWWEDGSKYNGEFVLGSREGWGEFLWPNGSRYEGQWRRGKPHGRGFLRSGDKIHAVWHEEGKMQSSAPVAKLRVPSTDELAVGMTKKLRKAKFAGKESYNEELVGEVPYRQRTIASGYRDGTNLVDSYLEASRRDSVLPEISRMHHGPSASR